MRTQFHRIRREILQSIRRDQIHIFQTHPRPHFRDISPRLDRNHIAHLQYTAAFFVEIGQLVRPHPNGVSCVVDQPDISQFRMLANIGVHRHCAFTAVLARLKVLANPIVKSFDMRKNRVLNFTWFAHCKSPAQIPPIPSINRPGIDDVELALFDSTVASKTTHLTTLVISVVKDLLTRRKMRRPLRRSLGALASSFVVLESS